MLDAVRIAKHVEHMDSPAGGRSETALRQIGELDAVIGEHGVDFIRDGFDRALRKSFLNRAHCFDGVQDQVQDDLLQLNTIRLNVRQPLGEAGLDRDAILDDCALRQAQSHR